MEVFRVTCMVKISGFPWVTKPRYSRNDSEGLQTKTTEQPAFFRASGEPTESR